MTSLTLVSVLSDQQVPLMRINGESMVLCVYIFFLLCVAALTSASLGVVQPNIWHTVSKCMLL